MSIEVKVPVLGESISEATIGEWLKKPGDTVAADEPIASLETDKVAVEAPSPVAGPIKEFKFDVGDTVEVHAVIAVLAEGDAPAHSSGDSDDAPNAANTHPRVDTAAPAQGRPSSRAPGGSGSKGNAGGERTCGYWLMMRSS